MAAAVGQDQLVRANVLRAREVHETIESGDFDLDRARKTARDIYLDALDIIHGEVVGSPVVSEELTPVMVELNKVTSLSHIQHNLHVLFPVIKAHRAVTELTWIACWREGNQPIYSDERDALFRIAAAVSAVLPHAPKVERGILISPAGARYEIACLDQAAKCLSPTEGVWQQFIESATDLVGGVAHLDLVGFFRALGTFGSKVGKEWIAQWYIDVFSLEWQATAITTVEEFERDIAPSVEKYIKRGDKYTLGLVKILAMVFQAPKGTAQLQQRAFVVLVQLVMIKPEYTIKEMVKHPKEVIDALLQRPDRYAESRSFAAMALLDIASKEANRSYVPAIKAVMQQWKASVEDRTSKKYAQEKSEANERAQTFEEEAASLDKRLAELNAQLAKTALGPARFAGKAVEQQLYSLVTENKRRREEVQRELTDCATEVALADALAAVDSEESALLDEILPML